MSYLLFKLAFDAPVHFGPSDSALSLYTSEEFFRADTLFSALCHTAGDELDRLVKSVQNDCLRFHRRHALARGCALSSETVLLRGKNFGHFSGAA